MYPIKTQPTCKDYLWGGTRLKDEYGKKTELSIVAESWELSCHPDGPCTVANGTLAGKRLTDILDEHPSWIGKTYREAREFPILVKLIDARQALSLQVHPADAFAWRVENQPGKNEMWYVVQAEPGAELILGFQRSLEPEELRQRIADNTIMDVVNRVKVHPGDCFCIPAGLLHAIGGGLLIAEIQQSSNVTYRVYDYDRRDASGNPRPLHVEQALQVVDTTLQAKNMTGNELHAHTGYQEKLLADWQYFHTSWMRVENSAALRCDPESFHCILALDGTLELSGRGEKAVIRPGETLFIPAGFGNYRLQGMGTALMTAME